MAKRALIVIDIQNDYFPAGKYPLAGIEEAAGKAAQVLAAARDAGDFVVHVRHEFAGDNAPFFEAGSEGAQIHPSVNNRADEPVVLKNNINAFRDTNLKYLLDDAGVEDVVIVGNMSHVCIDAATRAAADFGYRVSLIHDACATRDVEFNGVQVPAEKVHASYMAALGFAYANVQSTEDFLNSARTDASV